MGILGIEDLKFVSDEVDRKNRQALAEKGLDPKSLAQIEAAEEAVRRHKEFLAERPDVR